eukprot:3550821-Pleurochrysis_carterae.AAC.3
MSRLFDPTSQGVLSDFAVHGKLTARRQSLERGGRNNFATALAYKDSRFRTLARRVKLPLTASPHG